MAGSARGMVLYMGRMRHSQLYPIIDGATAVILPSRAENFSNACLEAFAHRKVVVGTHGTSFGEMIEDGINGFLCEPDSPSNLMQVTEKVLSLGDSERNAIGEKAAERLTLLKPELVAGKLLEYYKNIIQRRVH